MKIIHRTGKANKDPQNRTLSRLVDETYKYTLVLNTLIECLSHFWTQKSNC